VKIWISASVIFLMICSPVFGTGEVCFSEVQLGKLEKMKALSVARKKHIAILERQISSLKKAASKARWRCVPKPCRCILPWVITGVTMGGCAAGIVYMGVAR